MLNDLLLGLSDGFGLFNMLLSPFLLHFSSPSLVIILKLSDIRVHLRYDSVFLIDHVD